MRRHSGDGGGRPRDRLRRAGTVPGVDGQSEQRRGHLRIAGVLVTVKASALVTLAVLWLLVFTDLAGSRLPALTSVGVASIAAVAFLVSIVAHELGHAVVAHRLGLEVEDVTVFYLGGVTRLREEPEDPLEELAIALVGPLTNLLLAGLLFAAAAAVGQRTLAGVVLTFLADLNALVGVFNLIPAHPLDGGAILRAGLTALTRDRIRALRLTARAGQGLGTLLIVGGVTGSLLLDGLDGLGLVWLALIGLFVLQASRGGLLQAAVRARLEGITVADLATPLLWTARMEWTVAHVVADVARSQADGLVLDSGGRGVGLFGPDDLAQVPTNSWEHLTLEETMRTLLGDVDAGTPVTAVLSRFTPGQPAAWSVTTAGQHTGLLSSEQIVASLADAPR